MAITITCPHCKASLQLADEMAGKAGACKFCGGRVRVPEASGPGSSMMLTGNEEKVLRELAISGRDALVVLIESKGGDASQSPMRDCLEDAPSSGFAVRLLNTAGLSASESLRFLKKFAEVQAPQAKEKPAAAAAPPALQPEPTGFNFKGDHLGMPLSDFKRKHDRAVTGRRRTMPWCSDESPGRDIPELMCEGWMAPLGVVHARIDLPEENASPTIAGAKTDNVIYQFLDERLFQITIFFSTDDFPEVSQALRQKYDEPMHQQQNPVRLQWWRDDTTIELVQGRIHPREPSVVRYFHDELLEEAGQRKPDTTSDL